MSGTTMDEDARNITELGGRAAAMLALESAGGMLAQLAVVARARKAERQRECTPEEGERWQAQYADGARVGAGDGRFGREPRIPLVEEPAEIPGECGSQYVARHVDRAWQIAYSHAYRYQASRLAS